LTAWGHLQEAVGEQTLTDADLRAARVVPEGPGIRSGLKLFGPPLRPTGVSYTTTRIRQEAGGVVLVEAFAHYSFDGSRQNGGAFFFMFVRDRDVLRLVAEKGDFRDGL
jgi:hypothetical protein